MQQNQVANTTRCYRRGTSKASRSKSSSNKTGYSDYYASQYGLPTHLV